MPLHCLLAFAIQSSVSNPKPHQFKSFGNWTLSTSAAEKKRGDVTFTNKNGASSIVHFYKKKSVIDILKMKQSDYAKAPESVDISKSTWKANGWQMHLVIRRFDSQLVATFCAESNAEVMLGTTYFPVPLNKESISQIKGFYEGY